MNTAARIWLIRHAQSAANAGERTVDPRSIGLTDLGRVQAQALVGRILEVPQRVVVSPFDRTLATAAPLLENLRERGVSLTPEVWPIEELTYLSPVRCRGTNHWERHDWAHAYWTRADPHWCDGDGAESFHHFLARVRAFDHALRGLSGFCVVVGHGMFLKAFLWAQMRGFEATPESMTDYRAYESRAPMRNTEIVALRPSANHWHLESLGT